MAQLDSLPRFRWRRRSLQAKAFTLSAIGMGVGFGTCGLGLTASLNSAGGSTFVANAGAFLFLISLAVLIGTALIALGNWIAEQRRK